VGKVFKNKKCDSCDLIGQVIETWGRKYCKKCWDSKPKRGGGNSGMVPMKDLVFQDGFAFESGLHLQRTRKGEKLFATLYLTHYPESKGIVGRQVNYYIVIDGKTVGIVGGNSPPLRYLKFNNYFGEKYSEKNWLNNNVFRLIEREKNLGTQVLKLFRRCAKQDYEERYGDILVGLVTFVEPPRTGAVYKADNWDSLGITQGKRCFRRGDHGKWINKEWGLGTKKLIFAKQFFRAKNYAVEVSREIRGGSTSEGVVQFHDTAQRITTIDMFKEPNKNEELVF